MSKSRKVSIIIGAVMLLIIALGFLYLAIKIKTIPEIECIQSGDVKGHEDMYITMPIAKSWNDSGFHANQYDAVLTNNTYNVLKDWSVTLKLPNNAKINDSWNISFYENDDGTITIYNTPNQGYNDIIEPKESITFGFILFSNSDEEITDYVLKATPEAHMRDYPLYYVLWMLVFILIIFASINFGLALKDHQYRLRAERDQKIIIQSMKTFTNFIDAKDRYTRGHSIRVAFYTKKLAERLGFEKDDLYNIYYIALLHDVGKINIPDSILNKPGALTDEERRVIETHTTNGAMILKDFSSVPSIVEGAKYHHERYDGKGYPEGISGENIPLVARIINVADSFDAMNSDRCYRKAYPAEKIINELKEGAGKQFDPEVVKVLLDLLDDNSFKTMNSELNEM